MFTLSKISAVFVLSLNLFTLCVHAQWDLWIYQDTADPDFYNMKHYILQIMPAGKRSNGYHLDAALNNDGLTYRKRNQGDVWNLLSPGSKLLASGLTEAQKKAVLDAFQAEPAPDPTANPHENCQDFVTAVINRAKVASLIPAAKKSLYAVQEDLKPDNGAANEGSATTAGRYFAHTNNFKSGDAVKKWTFPGAQNPKKKRSINVEDCSAGGIQRRTPLSRRTHFTEGVRSPPLPAAKCPTGQKQRTRVDPKTKKMVPVTKLDPKTKKQVPDCVPSNTPTTQPGPKKPVGKPVTKPVTKKPVKKPITKKPVRKPVTRRPAPKKKTGGRRL